MFPNGKEFPLECFPFSCLPQEWSKKKDRKTLEAFCVTCSVEYE